MLTFEEARGKIIDQLGRRKRPCASTIVSVWEALGLVLAEEVKTDREYPPFDRSTREGYAVHAKEVAPETKLKCVGEIKAGDTVSEPLAAGACVQIMTGAAAPAGADAAEARDAIGLCGTGAGGAGRRGGTAMREEASRSDFVDRR